MHLTNKQPNIEFWNTECYGGPKQYTDFPGDDKYAFALLTELFSPRSRGTVSLKSKDPQENPVVDPNFLADELDILYLSEGMKLGNEIVMQGKGTKDVVKGSWSGELITLLALMAFCKDQLSTNIMTASLDTTHGILARNGFRTSNNTSKRATTLQVRPRWIELTIQTVFWTRSFV
jgi:hypothetical protein